MIIKQDVDARGEKMPDETRHEDLRTCITSSEVRITGEQRRDSTTNYSGKPVEKYPIAGIGDKPDGGGCYGRGWIN